MKVRPFPHIVVFAHSVGSDEAASRFRASIPAKGGKYELIFEFVAFGFNFLLGSFLVGRVPIFVVAMAYCGLIH